MSKKEVRFSAALTRDQAIATLEALTRALRAGPVRIAADGREVVIAPREVLGLELEVSHKPGKSKLELELTWRDYEGADEENDLRIEPAGIVGAAAEAGEADADADEAGEDAGEGEAAAGDAEADAAAAADADAPAGAEAAPEADGPEGADVVS
ncbi:MAG: amphi-Trp domain-containing protein [Myxococcales bacterium]|nr:amphi-Trp domain-containing protein [Myxococcales bacterium]